MDSERKIWIILISSSLMVLSHFTVQTTYGRTLVETKKSFPTSYISLLTITGAMVASLGDFLAFHVLSMTRLFGFKVVSQIGTAATVLGLILASMAKNEYQFFLAHGIVFAYGSLMTVNTGMFIVFSSFPPSHRFHVFATSIKLSLYSVSISIAPLGGFIFNATSWRITFLIFSAIILVTGAIICYTFANSTPPISEKVSQNTTSLTVANKDIKVTMLICSLCLAFTYFCIALTINMPVYILVMYCNRELGLSVNTGSKLVSYYGTSQMVGRLSTAFLGDRFLKDRLRFINPLLCFFQAALSVGLGYTATSNEQLIIFVVLMGLSAGPIMAGAYALCCEILCGFYIYEVYSFKLIAQGTGSFVGQAVFGLIYDMTGSFKYSFIFNAVVQLIAGIFAILVVKGRQTLQKLLNSE